MQNVVSRLVLALQIYLVSMKLHMKDRIFYNGQLTLLSRGIHAKSIEPAPILPLIKLINDYDSDLDIWTAILELLTNFY